jgi:hypothetical protein
MITIRSLKKDRHVEFDQLKGGIRVKDLESMLEECNPEAYVLLEYDGEYYSMKKITRFDIKSCWLHDDGISSIHFVYDKKTYKDVVQEGKLHDCLLIE